MFHEEYMTCREICAKYRAPGLKERSRYNAGQKRCQKCGLFVICNDLNCPCCGAKLRTKPRNTSYTNIFFNECEFPSLLRYPSPDAKACYQLDSFINSIKLNILTGVYTASEFDDILRNTFASMDNLGCPPPAADAGSSQSVKAGTTNVILDGSSSLYSSDHASFKWEQIEGTPTVDIKNANSAKALFDAPSSSELVENGLQGGTLVFQFYKKIGREC